MRAEEKKISRIIIHTDEIPQSRISITIEPIEGRRELVEIQSGDLHCSVVWKPLETDFDGATSIDFIRMHSIDDLTDAFGGGFYRRTKRYWRLYKIIEITKEYLKQIQRNEK